MKTVPVEIIIKSCAELTLNLSAVVGSSKTLNSLEETVGFKFDDVQKIEVLLSEIFVSQIPLALFLQERKETDLLDQYYQCLYEILRKKYDSPFGIQIAPEEFERKLQARYAEYYAFISREFVTKDIARATSDHIASDGAGLLSFALTALLTGSLVSINQFLKNMTSELETSTSSAVQTELTEQEKVELDRLKVSMTLAEVSQVEELIANCNNKYQFAKTHSTYVKDWERTKAIMVSRLNSGSFPSNTSRNFYSATIQTGEEIIKNKLETVRNSFETKFRESIYNYLGADGKIKTLFGTLFG